MDCKICGVPLLDDEIPDRMCSRCPEYCVICNNVLPWERLICVHGDEIIYKICVSCVDAHLKEHHASR